MKAYVVAFCGVLLATPALAEPSGTANASAPAASGSTAAPANAGQSNAQAHDGQRQICRRIDSDVSRRIGSRLVCHTAAEWREIQNAS